MIHLVLPDAWRIQLLRAPEMRDAWLAALDDQPGYRLLDWASPRPKEGDEVIVLGLDLAASELVLKLPVGVRIRDVGPAMSVLPGGRQSFLDRARQRAGASLALKSVPSALPADPNPLLQELARLESAP